MSKPATPSPPPATPPEARRPAILSRLLPRGTPSHSSCAVVVVVFSLFPPLPSRPVVPPSASSRRCSQVTTRSARSQQGLCAPPSLRPRLPTAPPHPLIHPQTAALVSLPLSSSFSLSLFSFTHTLSRSRFSSRVPLTSSICLYPYQPLRTTSAAVRHLGGASSHSTTTLHAPSAAQSD